MANVQLWNWLDWVLALIVLGSVVSGGKEGLTRGLIGLASLVVGLAVAASGYHSLGSSLSSVIHSHDLAFGVAFLILFILVLIIGGVISNLADRLLSTIGVRWLDRLLGLFFGLLRGIIADAVVVMVMLAFSIKPEAVRKSQLTPPVLRGSGTLAAWMPPDLHAQFDAGLEDLKRGWAKTQGRAKTSTP